MEKLSSAITMRSAAFSMSERKRAAESICSSRTVTASRMPEAMMVAVARATADRSTCFKVADTMMMTPARAPRAGMA